ncbi:hypothetical protein C2L64_44980 [Paraburkholderia hospita]|uniref:PASTA domain-containing protein n=1 Tax=Paraburkholderia hospita TaxID=169430 RepID=A0AAN1JK92_9BURK|nr:PASTA domain-containing protein [Paraburkholderia hospita]AUT75537.1 hypothetical protein C2L64_44980 [Paraburkholderia hospita]
MYGIQAVAAAAILNHKGISGDDKLRGIACAAIVPGVLGLAVPLIIAQQQKKKLIAAPVIEVAATVEDVSVPNVYGATADEAVAKLKKLGLTVIQAHAVADPSLANTVVKQVPHRDMIVPPGSEVTITIGDEPPPMEVPVDDVDADLTKKLNAAVADIETRFDAKIDEQTRSIVEAVRLAIEYREDPGESA